MNDETIDQIAGDAENITSYAHDLEAEIDGVNGEPDPKRIELKLQDIEVHISSIREQVAKS